MFRIGVAEGQHGLPLKIILSQTFTKLLKTMDEMLHKTDRKHSFSVLDRGKNLQLRSQLLLGCLLSLDAQLSQLLPPLIGNVGLLLPLLLKLLIEQTRAVRYEDTVG